MGRPRNTDCRPGLPRSLQAARLAVALLAGNLRRPILQKMPVVGGDHDHAPRIACLPQQGHQKPQVFEVPTLMQLIRSAQVIVDRVVDDTDDLLLRVRDRSAHLLRQVRRLRQVALVEEPRRYARTRVRKQRWVRREADLLLGRGAQTQPPAQQAQIWLRDLYNKVGSPDYLIGDHPDFLHLRGSNNVEKCAITTMFMDLEGSTRLNLFYTLEEVYFIKNAFIKNN